MHAAVKFKPLEEATLQLVMDVYEREGNDAVAAYGRLLTATMMAGAALGMRKEQVKQQALVLLVEAKNAMAARPDLFGDRS